MFNTDQICGTLSYYDITRQRKKTCVIKVEPFHSTNEKAFFSIVKQMQFYFKCCFNVFYTQSNDIEDIFSYIKNFKLVLAAQSCENLGKIYPSHAGF